MIRAARDRSPFRTVVAGEPESLQRDARAALVRAAFVALAGVLGAAGCGDGTPAPAASADPGATAAATGAIAPFSSAPPPGVTAPPTLTAAPVAPAAPPAATTSPAPPATAAPGSPPSATAGATAAPSAPDEGGGAWGVVVTVATVLFWLTVVGLCLRGLAAWFAARNRKRWGLPDTADEVCYARTADGWRLAVHHWRPRPGAGSVPGQLPVVLCHGLGANRFIFDTEGRSLARWLRDRGFDVWVPELRGTGFSDAPGKHEWAFDEHVEHDVPAILDLVLDRTGVRQVDWVGKSMGGMVMYAHLPRDGAKVRSLCAVGSPGLITGSVPNRLRSLGWVLPLIPRWLMPRVPLATFSALMAPLAGVLLPKWQRAFYNPDHIDHRVLRRISVSLPTDVSRDLLRQFSTWFEEGSFRSVDRRRDYRERLGEIKTPVLIIGGSADVLAASEAIEAVTSRLACEVRVEVVGLRYGHAIDYGHGDLLLGDNAPNEVFPIIAEWLESQGRSALGLPGAKPGQAPETAVAAAAAAEAVRAGAIGGGSAGGDGGDDDDDDLAHLGAEATVPSIPRPEK